MKCKRCKREIEKNSVFCNWCGHRQVAERREMKVPMPRRKGNSWYNQITIDGERVYISAASEEEYYAKARASKQRLIEIKKAAPKLTLGTAIDNYINNTDKVLSPSTVNSYRSYRKTRFQAYMEDDVSNINWQEMVNEEAKEKSPKTVHNAWRLVTASLAYADRTIPSVNLPQKCKNKRPFLDYQQIQTFCKAIKGKPYELGALLALNGLRRSELLHLTYDDIDTNKGVVYVRGASVIGKDNKLTDKKTNKNATSTRTVHIIIPRITYLVDESNGCKKDKLITTNPTTLYGLVNALCRRNKLPEVGVHGLRHSYISLCFHLGWDILTVMLEGGYSNTQTVNEVYRHLAAQDANDNIVQAKQFFNTLYGNTAQ